MDYRGESFINKAQGKITLEETNQEEETPEAEKETETELEKDLIVEKEWDDNENLKGRRPESVTIQLTANGKVVNNITILIIVIIQQKKRTMIMKIPKHKKKTISEY